MRYLGARTKRGHRPDRNRDRSDLRWVAERVARWSSPRVDAWGDRGAAVGTGIAWLTRADDPVVVVLGIAAAGSVGAHVAGHRALEGGADDAPAPAVLYVTAGVRTRPRQGSATALFGASLGVVALISAVERPRPDAPRDAVRVRSAGRRSNRRLRGAGRGLRTLRDASRRPCARRCPRSSRLRPGARRRRAARRGARCSRAACARGTRSISWQIHGARRFGKPP